MASTFRLLAVRTGRVSCGKLRCMSTRPLSHHEIISRVSPFTRRGRLVDLTATDRLERRVVFKTIEHPGVMDGAPPLREELVLENPRPEAYRLTRIVIHPSGLKARVEADGPDPGELLARIEAVPLARGFRSGGGYVMAESYRLDTGELFLTSVVAEAGGLSILVKMPTVRGYPAEISLRSAPGESWELPEDLLAVLGWDWRPIEQKPDEWVGTLRVRGREPERSRRAEERLETTVAHLARTLAEPPRLFHERFARARWGVAFRRAIPLLVCIALLVGAAALSKLDIPQESALQLLIFNAPPLMMIAFFSFREIPRIEIPPLPRPSRKAMWRRLPPHAREELDEKQWNRQPT